MHWGLSVKMTVLWQLTSTVMVKSNGAETPGNWPLDLG